MINAEQLKKITEKERKKNLELKIIDNATNGSTSLITINLTLDEIKFLQEAGYEVKKLVNFTDEQELFFDTYMISWE